MNTSAQAEARRFEAVVEILERYERDPSRLIPILQAVQDEYRYLPEEILAYIAVSLDLSPPRSTGSPLSTATSPWRRRAST